MFIADHDPHDHAFNPLLPPRTHCNTKRGSCIILPSPRTPASHHTAHQRPRPPLCHRRVAPTSYPLYSLTPPRSTLLSHTHISHLVVNTNHAHTHPPPQLTYTQSPQPPLHILRRCRCDCAEDLLPRCRSPSRLFLLHSPNPPSWYYTVIVYFPSISQTLDPPCPYSSTPVVLYP